MYCSKILPDSPPAPQESTFPPLLPTCIHGFEIFKNCFKNVDFLSFFNIELNFHFYSLKLFSSKNIYSEQLSSALSKVILSPKLVEIRSFNVMFRNAGRVQILGTILMVDIFTYMYPNLSRNVAIDRWPWSVQTYFWHHIHVLLKNSHKHEFLIVPPQLLAFLCFKICSVLSVWYYHNDLRHTRFSKFRFLAVGKLRKGIQSGKFPRQPVYSQISAQSHLDTVLSLWKCRRMFW